MMVRHRVPTIVFLAFVLPMSSCGSTLLEQAAPAVPAAGDALPSTEALPADLPVLHVGSLGLTSLDAADLSGAGDREIGRLIHRGLTTIGGDGLPAPGIARSWATTDDVTWEFALGAGHTFHDGSPITAPSFVEAIDHLLDPEAGALGGYLADLAGIIGAAALDDTTLEITLNRPNALLPLIVAEPTFAPRASSGTIVGSGPYTWVGDWDGTGRLDLVPYAAFHGRVPGHAIAVHFFETVEEMYASEDLDISDVPPEEADRMKLTAAGERLRRPPVAAYNYIALPLNVDPFDDYRVRRALSLAIDRQAIVEEVFGAGKTAVTGFTPSRSTGAVPNNCHNCRYDPEEARRLMKAAGGIPDGVIEFAFNTGSEHEVWVQAVADQWIEVFGIEVQFRPESAEIYFDDIESGLMKGPYRLAWSSDFSHAMSFLEPLFVVDERITKGFNDERLGLLAEEFHHLSDPYGPEGAHIVAAMARVLDEQMPIIPLFADRSFQLISERVSSVRSLASGVLALEDAILTE